MNKRLDLKVGFSCNNNCVFCAQSHKKHLVDKTTEQLKNDLLLAFKNGCDEVVFTGGEPTIRKDIFELVSFSNDIGYELIQIQTNGRMFSYNKVVEKLIRSGVTEFSPAIHGHTAEVHDVQTRVKGSWNQTTQGIKNLKDSNQYIISNSVITKFNYRFLPELVELLLSFNVSQFQLAFVHPVGNALKYFDDVVPRKKDVQPFIHKALDIAKEHGIKENMMMVEAYPFCLMQGYEKFCSEPYIPKAEVRDSEMIILEFEKWRKEQGKTKSSQCVKCKFDLICEGSWKEYAQKYGYDEFISIEGDKIQNLKSII